MDAQIEAAKVAYKQAISDGPPEKAFDRAICAALAAAQAAGTSPTLLQIANTSRAQGFAAGIEAAAKTAESDERFLALALCGEAGELANMIKKPCLSG